MTCNSDLIINPGTDWLFHDPVFDDGGQIDGTGMTASIYDATGVLGGAVSAGVVTSSPLVVSLGGTWQAGWPLTAARLGSFRYSLVNGGAEIGSFAVTVYVNAAEDEVEVARGSDLTVEYDWQDDRLGLDMSGDTLTVINPAPDLVGRISVSIVDPVARKVRWTIEGDQSMPVGDLGTFQLQRATGGLHRRTTNLIRVICK